MSKIVSSNIKSAAKAGLGILAAALLTHPASAQYVGTEISSGLNEPAAVVTDSSGNLYITDSSDNRIAEYVPSSGSLTTFAGMAGTQFAGTNNGLGSQARFSQPRGMVVARGGLIVADQANQLIRYVSFNGAVSNLAGVAGVIGANNGPALQATFSFPNGLVADAAGNIYIADEGDGIRLLDTNNVVSTVNVGGYQFSDPSAVALDDYNNLWVADTGNDVICLVSNGVVTVVAGIPGFPGTNDSPIATAAQFNSPGGLMWSGVNNSLIVSDTGNDTIRELFQTNFNGSIGYAVQTVAGSPAQPGLVNGSPGASEFSSPTGIAVDLADSGFFIVDTGNDVVRVLQPAAPQPPVSTPELGYVTFIPNGNGGYSSVFNETSGAVFNNPAILAVKGETGTETYLTYGATPANPLENTIPQPGPGTGITPSLYPGDGNPPPIPSILAPMPDMTVYVIDTAPNRQPSPVVSARFQFVTANPIIVGDNAASILVTDLTTNAQIWYTLDGSEPVQNGTNSFGPLANNQIFSLNLTTNVTLTARAFAAGFQPSGPVSTVFSPANVVGDQLTFGFASGVASSEFIAAAGQRFYAPVSLTLLPTANIMYSMQFDLAVTNLGNSPPVGQTYDFLSMLMKPDPILPGFFIPIEPAMGGGTNLLLGDDALNLLEVGWVERPPFTNLYPTPSQTLITYSLVHDTLFENSGDKVVAGAYSFVVPSSATNGQTYQIDVGNGSATSDGITTPVFVQMVTNGSLGQGAMNSVKIVTVGSARYLVGDVAPFRWFNAGDFGDTNLEANDVTETFQSAIYDLNVPLPGSDYFDAMDSSNGKDNNYYDGNDTDINLISMGDGSLGVDDVYVTYRRSLDYSLTWYARYWTNGNRLAVTVPNGLTPLSQKPAQTPHKMAQSGPRYVTVAADQVISGGSLNVQVPIRVLAADTMPLRVLMFNVEVDPLDGSPAISVPVTFSAAAGLNTTNTLTDSLAVNMYAEALLDSSVAGIIGTNIIGTLNITLPTNVTANSSYLVHFDHFSASPNGLALFHATVNDGLITVGNRTGSSWNDGIPDTWRLLYFGTVSNALSAANADADGDGASNWQEFIAGTNPMDATSVFQVQPTAVVPGGGFILQWPSVVNKVYSIQCSPASGLGQWTTLVTNLVGTGQPMQWTDLSSSGTARLYRASVQ